MKMDNSISSLKTVSSSLYSYSTMDVFAFYQNKRVLVTGHTGFKGAWLSEWLIELGAKVAGFSLDPSTHPHLFETLELHQKMEDHRGDLNDLQALTKIIQEFDPEIIFHLAAQPLVRASYENPVETFRTNTLGTAHVLEAARKAPSLKAAVMITTDKVYAPNSLGTPHSEGDRLGGYDPYSASKSADEMVIQSYAHSFFHAPLSPAIASVRAGNVIGGGDWSEDRLIPDAVRAWQNKTPLVIRNPSSIRPWQHVLEPIYGYLQLGMLLATEPNRFRGKSYNFGPLSEEGARVEEILEFFKNRWSGFSWEVDPNSMGNKKETHLLRLSWEKAKRELEWEPLLDLETTLEWTSVWYEDFYRSPSKGKEATRKQIQKYQESCK